jgi:dihydrofolate reductase
MCYRSPQLNIGACLQEIKVRTYEIFLNPERKNQMKISTYISTTLDGFIAREDGSIDWLATTAIEGEDFGFGEFNLTVDAIVMGRKAFETIHNFGSWPYGSKPVYILTSRPQDLPEKGTRNLQPIAGTPGEIVQQLSGKGYDNVYIEGSKVIQAFVCAGLIDHFIITRVPVLIGQGIPLFGPLEKDVKLQHVFTRVYPNGFEQSDYQVIR